MMETHDANYQFRIREGPIAQWFMLVARLSPAILRSKLRASPRLAIVIQKYEESSSCSTNSHGAPRTGTTPLMDFGPITNFGLL
jgi:hypothetical protein